MLQIKFIDKGYPLTALCWLYIILSKRFGKLLSKCYSKQYFTTLYTSVSGYIYKFHQNETSEKKKKQKFNTNGSCNVNLLCMVHTRSVCATLIKWIQHYFRIVTTMLNLCLKLFFHFDEIYMGTDCISQKLND